MYGAKGLVPLVGEEAFSVSFLRPEEADLPHGSHLQLVFPWITFLASFRVFCSPGMLEGVWVADSVLLECKQAEP